LMCSTTNEQQTKYTYFIKVLLKFIKFISLLKCKNPYKKLH